MHLLGFLAAVCVRQEEEEEGATSAGAHWFSLPCRLAAKRALSRAGGVAA